MKLSAPSGDELELSIYDYQTPQGADNPYDLNWLRIRVRAKMGGRSWETMDPCLLTWEVESLAQAFSSVAQGDPSAKNLQFTEPNLWFTVTNLTADSAKLRVHFELESRPAWEKTNVAFSDDLYIEFDLPLSEFADLADDLREQLLRFPLRGAQP